MLLHWLVLTANGAIIDSHLLGSWAAGWTVCLASLLLLVPGSHALVLLTEGAMRQRFAAACRASVQHKASSSGCAAKSAGRSSCSEGTASSSDSSQHTAQSVADMAHDDSVSSAEPSEQRSAGTAQQDEQAPPQQPAQHPTVQGDSNMGQHHTPAPAQQTAQQAQQARARAQELARQAALQFVARQALYRGAAQAPHTPADTEGPAACREGPASDTSEGQAPGGPQQPADAFPDAWLAELADSLVKARASSGQAGAKPSWLLQRKARPRHVTVSVKVGAGQGCKLIRAPAPQKRCHWCWCAAKLGHA